MKTADIEIKANSNENQRIKGQFVAREVKACFSYEMDEIIKKEVVSYDEIENLYYLPVENIFYDALNEFDDQKADFIEYANNPETFNRRVKTKGDFEVFLNSLEDTELVEFAEEFYIECEELPQEIFEWWIVSEYLYRKLKEKNEPVLEWGNNCYWGRCSTGQAILLDGVISEICAEMEILSGQKYAWSKE